MIEILKIHNSYVCGAILKFFPSLYGECYVAYYRIEKYRWFLLKSDYIVVFPENRKSRGNVRYVVTFGIVSTIFWR